LAAGPGREWAFHTFPHYVKDSLCNTLSDRLFWNSLEPTLSNLKNGRQHSCNSLPEFQKGTFQARRIYWVSQQPVLKNFVHKKSGKKPKVGKKEKREVISNFGKEDRSADGK